MEEREGGEGWRGGREGGREFWWMIMCTVFFFN
jgi:hypothetical protein